MPETPRSPSHKLYVDESGTKEYSDDGLYPKGGGRSQYLDFAGLLLTPVEAGLLDAKLKALKLDCFGTEAVEIKANWLKRPAEREKRYLAPHNISSDQLDAFVEATYDLLAGSKVEIVASIVDKAAVQATYPPDRRWYPPAIAYECMMQRVQMAMSDSGGFVSVTVDDMSGATPKGNQYKTNLEAHHRRLRSAGSQLQLGMKMDRLLEIGFSDSKADERLQLADLAAYSVFRQFADHAAAWDGDGPILDTYPYFKRLAPRFRSGPGGVVSGYGLVKFPRTSKVSWVLRENKKP